MNSAAARFQPGLLSPLHWPAWIGIGVLWLLSRLPYRVLMAAGRCLGGLIAWLPGSRRRIAQRNIALCFPGLDTVQQARLLEQNLRDVGLMLAEFALAWMGSSRAIARVPVTIEGIEHVAAATARGQGVLLTGAHFSHLELAGRLLVERGGIELAGMYREHGDAAFEWAIRRSRQKYAATMFTKNEVRACVRYMKAGGCIWYAPDQDMRGKDTVFVPFFGVPASTLTATHHLARLSGACVIPFFHRRLPDGGYALRLEAPLAGFPGADVTTDTARINAMIERMVREAPSQYLWIHRRFKSRPAGQESLYR
ncbi:MAG: LpxL/LpxP family Kdo(2)-lipid IV(A) lauroyl/palmitoleoyl acyltransferase [Dokdonella sp.]|uniref:LpxL/LpxP family Kdo(2)-lipid IV(A) lauroyl/palmitoleoyl acyltransferase n=1 Tax=Dokdonella sp. TaxID=2291710 RepID=UPI002BC36088|nr:LpxL/LpxP family Kdo(2)-lipid IV(A) lauroyl/palmitoleoyl acyltransferase [Dokdonella sp.]HOX70528.1 LpxL/LpxP family Kdo(2)-lipid IV(A) lauroyl/palmitoleoyl acyltransferase [Dokdonella sp.]